MNDQHAPKVSASQRLVISNLGQARGWLKTAIDDALKADRVDCRDALLTAVPYLGKALRELDQSMHRDGLS